jgi:hypothetical protein
MNCCSAAQLLPDESRSPLRSLFRRSRSFSDAPAARGASVAAVAALGVGGFAIGTAKFVIMGLLPEVARDLQVTIPEAGHVISAYAIGVVIGAPVLAVLAAHWRRRALLVALIAMFAAGNLASALAPGYLSLNLLRFVAGLPHGTYFGVRRWSPRRWRRAHRRASAVGLVMLGTDQRHAARRADRRMAGPALRLARGLRARRRDRGDRGRADPPQRSRPAAPPRRQPAARAERTGADRRCG